MVPHDGTVGPAPRLTEEGAGFLFRGGEDRGRGLDLRTAPRALLSSTIPGEVSARIPVVLLDLSERGARLEHARPMSPGMGYGLAVLLEGGDTILKVRVVWSVVARLTKRPGGEGDLFYHSGVEFLELRVEQRARIASTLCRVESVPLSL